MKRFIIAIIFIVGILLETSAVSAMTGLNIKDLLTDQTLHDLEEGKKLKFDSWNKIVISITEDEINEIFINRLLKNYLDTNPELLPKKTAYKSAKFNTDKGTLNVAVLYGALKIRINAEVTVDTADEHTLSVNKPKLRIMGIPIPGFITKWILKDAVSYTIDYQDIIGPDSPVQVDRIQFESGTCHVGMIFPEEKVVDMLQSVIPTGKIELLKEKHISDYMDLSQLSDMHFYISEETVNRIFNEQLHNYVEGGNTVIPNGLQIDRIAISLKDRLLNAHIGYMGFGMDVEAEFIPYCQGNVVGIDIGEMYLGGQQIPSAIKQIMDEFTKNVRFDLYNAGIPTFIRLKGLNLLENELDLNLSIDLLNREPVKIEQLEFLLGPGVGDQNAFFEYFAPISTLSQSINKLLTVELLQSAINNIIDKAHVPEGLDLLINEDFIRVTEFTMDIADKKARIELMVWNMPMEMNCNFTLSSDEKKVSLSFSDMNIIPDGQAIPSHILTQIMGDDFGFTAGLDDISRFLFIDELVFKKLALEDTGLVIQFTIT